MNTTYLYLGLSISTEILGTSMVKSTHGFTRPGPTLFVLAAYGLTAYFFSKTVDQVSLGVVYALWCGIGITAVSAIACFAYGEKLDTAALVGMILITAGVMTIHLFSSSVT